ncbi:hypothetical protein CMT41_10245 [Colwellia sp. MT41]|nr:hypothetical protein CMT41_10245 [Colwellia sp. MT41]
MLLPLTLVVSSPTFASDDFTFGIGLGSLYSGIGVNTGMQSNVDLKYISAGCVSYSSQGSTCAMGIGWVKTDIFGFKHQIMVPVYILALLAVSTVMMVPKLFTEQA